jgi:hypothetical protein
MILYTTNISNAPLTGLKRSIDVIAIIIDQHHIELRNLIYSLDINGVRITGSQATPHLDVDIADNTTLVDPANGQYVIQTGVDINKNPIYSYDGGANNGQPFVGAPVGEYTFLIGFLNQNVNIVTLISEYIQLNDSLGKYNI